MKLKHLHLKPNDRPEVWVNPFAIEFNIRSTSVIPPSRTRIQYHMLGSHRVMGETMRPMFHDQRDGDATSPPKILIYYISKSSLL